MSSIADDSLTYSVVAGAVDAASPREGDTEPFEATFCSRVLGGQLPNAISDARRDPRTAGLEITARLNIGAYAGAPMCSASGKLVGMVCCISSRPQPDLGQNEAAIMAMLADITVTLVGSDSESDSDRDSELLVQTLALVTGHGRRLVLQPIVDVSTGVACGFEALSRFDDQPYRPDLWFALADRVGLRVELEVAAARSALGWLSQLHDDEYLSVNLSGDAIVERLDEVLSGTDVSKLVIELTEHDRVSDYDGLLAVLNPYLARGLRIAVDDAGAGYSSFRHILRLRPALIKADMDLVRGIDSDPVRQALLAALLSVARTSGAVVVAEGVETKAELDCLWRLGVRRMQGFLLARPADTVIRSGFPTPTKDSLAAAAALLSVELGQILQSATSDIAPAARQVLDLVLRTSGLQTSYLTVLHPDSEMLEHRWVNNAGPISLPEGFEIPWEDSLCRVMRENELLWSGDPQSDLAECWLAAQFGLQTFLSLPLTSVEGKLVGTLCAGSMDRVYLSDRCLAQLQLIAQVMATLLPAAAHATPA